MLSIAEASLNCHRRKASCCRHVHAEVVKQSVLGSMLAVAAQTDTQARARQSNLL